MINTNYTIPMSYNTPYQRPPLLRGLGTTVSDEEALRIIQEEANKEYETLNAGDYFAIGEELLKQKFDTLNNHVRAIVERSVERICKRGIEERFKDVWNQYWWAFLIGFASLVVFLLFKKK